MQLLLVLLSDWRVVGGDVALLSVDARALQAASMSLNVPLAGSLSPIYGTVMNLVNPSTYRFCVYLRSTASGADLFNGPKPFEDAGSSSPIANDGFANDVYDPAAPYIYGFAYPIALGNCLPVMGEVGMPIPALMFSLSGAWVVVDRVSTISLRILDAPALGATADVRVAVSGLPETAGTFSVWWWFSADGVVLTGPLPSCAAVGVPLVAGSTAGAATATLPFDPELASANARFLTVALLPAAAAAGTQNLCGEAMTPLPGARLPPAIAGATLAFDVASSSRTPTRANFLEIRNTSGASRAAPAFAAAVVAFFAALCGAWLL